jgi:hypothetical protein
VRPASFITRLLTVCSLALSACGGTPRNHLEDPGSFMGKATEQEASQALNDISFVVLNNPTRFPEISPSAFKTLMLKATVKFQDTLMENGKEVEASNDGISTVLINTPKWSAQSLAEMKRALVFHELLRIMKVENSTKWISKRLLSFENRFLESASYQCQGTHTSDHCMIALVYEPSLHAFAVTDNDCGNFPTGQPDRYYGRGRKFRYCDQITEPSEPASCALPESKWSEINFSGDFDFSFSGVGELSCKPSN